jgi:hypothetical protein
MVLKKVWVVMVKMALDLAAVVADMVLFLGAAATAAVVLL